MVVVVGARAGGGFGEEDIGFFLGGIGLLSRIVQVAAETTHISNPPASWMTLPEELFLITSNFPSKVVWGGVEVNGLQEARRSERRSNPRRG